MSHQTDSNPVKIPKRHGGAFNPRSITMPIAAITMALILYTYSVTSIRAAKRNAQLHREADGGQLDMRRESLRRHGVLDRVEGTTGVELFRNASNTEEEKQRDEDDSSRGGRTDVESSLESYKGLATSEAVKKFKEERAKGG